MAVRAGAGLPSLLPGVGLFIEGLGDVSLADRLRSAVRGPGRPPAFQGTFLLGTGTLGADTNGSATSGSVVVGPAPGRPRRGCCPRLP